MTRKIQHHELDDNELMRYARQILLNDWDMDAQLKLKNSHVLIVGVGGLGCPVSQILARAGVGFIRLVDFDVVTRSNLQRQILFTEKDIGQSKAMVAGDALKHHNEFICVEAMDVKLEMGNIIELFERLAPNLVVDCTDNFDTRYLVNNACRQLNIPLLSNSAIGEVGQIALFDETTGCYECVFGQDKETNISVTQNCATSGVLTSTVSIIGAMSAQLALNYLGRGKNPIANQLLLWQGKTMTLQKVQFHQNLECQVCVKS